MTEASPPAGDASRIPHAPWPEYVRTSVTSTMEWAREIAAESGAGVDAFRVRAERQTAGRGRRGSRWLDRAGAALLTTVAIRRGGAFDPRDPNPATIALRAGNAVFDLASSLGVDGVSIKWPNDILCRDRKLCGILVEADPRWFYIGIGLNVAPVAEGSYALPPISLNELLPQPVALSVPVSLIDAHLLRALRDPAWHTAINARLAWQGLHVRLENEGKDALEGRLLDVDQSGAIRIMPGTEADSPSSESSREGVAITPVSVMAGTLRLIAP